MDTTTDKEEKLIHLVQEHKCLYEKTHKDYFRTTEKERHWRQIGVELELEGKACMILWSSLRNQFSKYLRKLANPSGSGRGRLPYFRHAESMRFLKDNVLPNENTTTNIPMSENEDEDEDILDDFDSDSNRQNTNREDLLEMRTIDREELQAMLRTDDNSFPTPSPQTVPRAKPQSIGRSHSKYGNKRKLDDFEKELLEKVNGEDEFDSFGSVIASKLRIISQASRKKFLMVQKTINILLIDIELDILNENEEDD